MGGNVVSVSGSGRPYLEESALVVAKRAADEQTPTEVHLIGYLGRDPEPGFWRVYFNDRLESYVRVGESSVAATVRIPETRDPMRARW